MRGCLTSTTKSGEIERPHEFRDRAIVDATVVWPDVTSRPMDELQLAILIESLAKTDLQGAAIA